MFALAGWALRRELADVHAGELARDLAAYGWRHAALAAACTMGSFLALGEIERLALRAAAPDAHVSRGIAMLTAFVANAFSQSAGIALLTGTAVRMRAYARHGMDAAAVTRVSGFVTLTVTLGLVATGASGLLASTQPLPLPGMSSWVRLVGVPLALLVVGYVAWSITSSQEHVGRGRWQLRRPTGLVALAQLSLASIDWLLAATVLFAVLPPSAGLGYWELLRAYLVAQTIGMVSHVPGGVGVLELVMLALVASGDPVRRAAVVAGLVTFRIVYYVVPLLLAVVVAAVTELRARGRTAAQPQRATELPIAMPHVA